MIRRITPTEIDRVMRQYPVVEEGGEMLESESTATTAVVGPVLRQALDEAMEGKATAWGVLYRAAASYAARCEPMPAELSDVIAKRLQMLGDALSKPARSDLRAAVLQAAAPYPKAVRAVGAKRRVMTADLVAWDVLAMADSGMSRKAAARKVSQLLPKIGTPQRPLYSPETLEVAAKRLQKLRAGGGE